MSKENGLGIAGFVLGLLSLILFLVFFISIPMAILAIIFCSVQIKKNSTGLAVAGLVLGILGLLGALLVGFFWAVGVYYLSSISNVDVSDNLEKSIVMVRDEVRYFDLDDKLYKNSLGGSGVIFYDRDGVVRIFTNRHVVDCSYSNLCGQRVNESIKVITKDGRNYPVSKVYNSPNGLDIAVLEISEKMENYSIVNISYNFKEGDSVVAIGYPAFSSNAREFSKARGELTDFRSLLTESGFRFEAIDSNAYTYFGSSGGGLFDKNGNLIGLTTWMDQEGTASFAISSKSFPDFGQYLSCNTGYYTEEGCAEYCSDVLNSELKCVSPCDDFYCKTEKINARDDRCEDSRLVLGTDDICHQACGSTDTYCIAANSYCYENDCVSCPSGYSLYTDGHCYKN